MTQSASGLKREGIRRPGAGALVEKCSRGIVRPEKKKKKKPAKKPPFVFTWTLNRATVNNQGRTSERGGDRVLDDQPIGVGALGLTVSCTLGKNSSQVKRETPDHSPEREGVTKKSTI